eukprot:scaffold8631_cov108-Isochrysis_galbana.AAC.20
MAHGAPSAPPGADSGEHDREQRLKASPTQRTAVTDLNTGQSSGSAYRLAGCWDVARPLGEGQIVVRHRGLDVGERHCLSVTCASRAKTAQGFPNCSL